MYVGVLQIFIEVSIVPRWGHLPQENKATGIVAFLTQVRLETATINSDDQQKR